jgi:hypothetical protein
MTTPTGARPEAADQLDIRATFRSGRWVVRVDDGDTVTRGGGATLAEAYQHYTEDLP